jgi:hypothetical protein
MAVETLQATLRAKRTWHRPLVVLTAASIPLSVVAGIGVFTASRLHVGVTTVKTHVTVLMAKTGCPNRVRLALLAHHQ